MTEAADAEPLTLIEFGCSNVKRVRLLRVEVNGAPLVLLNGQNGAGKTSAQDAFMMLFSDKRAECPEPVTRGEEKGEAWAEFGPYRLRKRWRASGGRATVDLTYEGEAVKRPQETLDGLFGEAERRRFAFDPFSWCDLPDKAMADALADAAGLDLGALDASIEAAYGRRTVAGRDVKAARGRLDAMGEVDPDAPAEEESVADLLAAAGARAEVEAKADAAEHEHQRLIEEVAQLERRLNQARLDRDRAGETVANLRASILDGETAVALRERVAEVEDRNRRARAAASRRAAAADLASEEAKHAELDAEVDRLRAERVARIEAAALPAGLGFDEAGRVTLGGFPFDQAGTAEKLRAAVELWLTKAPRLRVILVRRGESLDRKRVTLVRELAREHRAHVLMERVTEDDELRVVVEDATAEENPF